MSENTSGRKKASALLFFILLLAGVVLIALGFFSLWFAAVGLAVMAAAVVVSVLANTCPVCRKWMGRKADDPKRCPKCGAEIGS